MVKPLTICLFCGSRDGNSQQYVQDAQALAEALARRSWNLVYGGGGSGLMGKTAQALLNLGGSVTGIIPQSLMDLEKAHPQLSELIITQSMHERKQKMVNRSDAFVVLPGGFGTFDELCEVVTWAQLGIHQKPIVLINSDGFWSEFLSLVQQAVKAGFILAPHQDLLTVAATPEEALAVIETKIHHPH